MFVHPDYQGTGDSTRDIKGIGKMGMQNWAIQSCVLETGQKQPEAIQLYLKTGYQRIPNYGQYERM